MNLTIEQMREIVDGAPVEAKLFQFTGELFSYLQECNGDHFWFNPNSGEWELDYSDIRTMQSLNDLRAAIADHDRTDHVTDIRNHISPNTRVSEAHVNETYKLNRLG